MSGALASARSTFRESLNLGVGGPASSRSAAPSARSSSSALVSARPSARPSAPGSARSSASALGPATYTARGSARSPAPGSSRSALGPSASARSSPGSARSELSARTWRTEDMNTGRCADVLDLLKSERLDLTRRLRAVQEEIDEEDRREMVKAPVAKSAREPVLKTRKPIWLKKKRQGPRDPMKKY
ncbi:hypothetical protein TeGR_g15273 [Tetraparma gracilis]|uniref:Uncharacterized protein n=1 Tax=Tetraparma gracilis TaxID=2962635 RepID=A0ABQ6MYN7_9STRA|nr:hypothetical protein TeGR_g15273 [Tetraparma gracilis]